MASTGSYTTVLAKHSEDAEELRILKQQVETRQSQQLSTAAAKLPFGPLASQLASPISLSQRVEGECRDFRPFAMLIPTLAWFSLLAGIRQIPGVDRRNRLIRCAIPTAGKSQPHNATFGAYQLPNSPIAREAMARTVTSDMRPSAIISNLALVVMGMASAGVNAAAVQKARNK